MVSEKWHESKGQLPRVARYKYIIMYPTFWDLKNFNITQSPLKRKI